LTEALISWFEAGEKKVVAEKPDPATEHSLGADPCHECRWRQASSKYTKTHPADPTHQWYTPKE